MGGEAITSPPARPEQHRQPVSLLSLFFGVLGGPVAWAWLFLVNYAVVSHFCYPDGIPHAQPNPAELGWVWGILWGMAGAALLTSIAATVVSYLNWRAARSAGDEADPTAEPRRGRIRFLAIWGMITGAAFTLAIIFNYIDLIGMSLCF